MLVYRVVPDLSRIPCNLTRISCAVHLFIPLVCLAAQGDQGDSRLPPNRTQEGCHVREDNEEEEPDKVQDPVLQGVQLLACLSALRRLTGPFSSQYLYTLTVKDAEKAKKLKQSLPPGLSCTDI